MQQRIVTVKIIHIALIAFVIIACFVLGDLKYITNAKLDASNFAFLLIPVVAYFFGNYMFQNVFKGINEMQSTEDKMLIYIRASIVRWAILEVVCFFILIIKPELLIINVVVLLFMMYLRPSKDHIKQTLNLRDSDFK